MFLLVVLVYSEIIDLPWGVYGTFVLEEKHGFNKQVGGTGYCGAWWWGWYCGTRWVGLQTMVLGGWGWILWCYVGGAGFCGARWVGLQTMVLGGWGWILWC